MSFFKKFLGIDEGLKLQIDFDQPPSLPNGTTKVIQHQPVAKGVLTLTPNDFKLERMPAFVPYANYRNENASKPLCDALILDAFIKWLIESKEPWPLSVYRLFGIRSGQIFFLGTSFSDIYDREVIPYLNVKTHKPALRYVCPAENTIRWDIPLYSCSLQKTPIRK